MARCTPAEQTEGVQGLAQVALQCEESTTDDEALLGSLLLPAYADYIVTVNNGGLVHEPTIYVHGK